MQKVPFVRHYMQHQTVAEVEAPHLAWASDNNIYFVDCEASPGGLLFKTSLQGGILLGRKLRPDHCAMLYRHLADAALTKREDTTETVYH